MINRKKETDRKTETEHGNKDKDHEWTNHK